MRYYKYKHNTKLECFLNSSPISLKVEWLPSVLTIKIDEINLKNKDGEKSSQKYFGYTE